VDSLHVRSGFPRSSLAELHGNCFAERCEACGAEAVRDFEQATVGFKLTGRRCARCGGRTRDQVLDWDDALPAEELAAAEAHSKAADLALTLGAARARAAQIAPRSERWAQHAACVCVCTGTSLQIHPSCDLPLKTRRAGGALAIVNLQRTPKDRSASLLIRRRADDVMRAVCAGLGLSIPPFVRHDALRCAAVTGNASAKAGSEFSLLICSCHGEKCQVPWLTAVEVSFPDADAVALPPRRRGGGAPPPAAEGGEGGGVLLSGPPPWRLRCRAAAGPPPPSDAAGSGDAPASQQLAVRVALRLRLAEGCTERFASLLFVARLFGDPSAEKEGTLLRVKTVEVHYEGASAPAAAPAEAPAEAPSAAAVAGSEAGPSEAKRPRHV
jgi:NAD-dependent SIR2 family protein deacetylase